MDYFFGGYLLLRLPLLNWEQHPFSGKKLWTCSTCFNESLIDSWSYSWCCVNETTPYDANTTLLDHVRATYALDDEELSQLQSWCDDKFNEDKIGWPNLFVNLNTALEYHRIYLKQAPNCYLFALYFDEDSATRFITHHQPMGSQGGELGVCQILRGRQREQPNNHEQLLGYDVVGLELSGEFHSFHCHNMADDLSQRFNLTINQYGLFDPIENWQPVINYMNEDSTACEPAPWGIAKIKQIQLTAGNILHRSK